MNNDITILIAEDNDISRELMASILKVQGYGVMAVSDGSEAIKAVNEHRIDLALVDLNMEPKGGFEFARYLLLNKIKVPVIVVTADESSDVLLQASGLDIRRVLQKPVDPERLINIVSQTLKKQGHVLSALVTEIYETKYTPEQLMQRAVELAERNAHNKKGGPFGAVVADKEGNILGEGVNGITSRVDPIAHAEIMAIRKASEKLGRPDLSDCVLYCSSTPTMMGKALIISVGIKKVYYGLSHEEINSIRRHEERVHKEISGKQQQTEYIQLGHDHAMKVFQRWEEMEDRLED
ncbi:MAG: response regulator [Alphaproteobacteria bacterium]|nr:response regulator [Alphaproteobacteria bacterium]